VEELSVPLSSSSFLLTHHFSSDPSSLSTRMANKVPPANRAPPAHKAPAFKHPDLSLTEALYNHLVLPPQLPHRQDPNILEVEDDLLDRVLASAQCMRDLPGNELYSTWDAITRSIQAAKTISSNGNIDRLMLARELESLEEKDFLVVHVRRQNCAMFIYRSKE
jgi:hypothetical protein